VPLIDRPETRYAHSGDVMVAYQVTGVGNPIDLVVTPGTVSNLDVDWEGSVLSDRITSFSRQIRFDKRGTGMSDRGVHAATLEQRTDDIRAVMDAVHSERAFMLGFSEGGSMACLFAATYPERTRGLLLWGTMPRWVSSPDYPWGAEPAEYARVIDELAERGATAEYLIGMGAGLGKASEAEIDEYRRYFAAAASPSQLASLERMNLEIDIRAILPTIRVPTLVLNRVADPVAPIEAVRAMAVQIPGARLIEFQGTTHRISGTPETEAILDAIEEFATGERPLPARDRVLATVVFIDVVGSTERAAAVGDRAWRELLGEYHGRVRTELVRFGGREIDTAGDGTFSTFDGPARGVRFAQAIGAAVSSMNIEVRAGVHTGEVELAGDEVRGIAVHIGARVAALAGSAEVLVTSTVKDLTAGSGLVYVDRGDVTLKGVPGQWHLYEVTS
jgi:pimeloyl-ACP methyl ester carboxylesterase